MQVAIIGLVLFADYDFAQQTHEAPRPALALVLGLGLAWAATFLISMLFDLPKAFRARRGRSRSAEDAGSQRLPASRQQ